MVLKDDIVTWWFARLKKANVNEVPFANVLGLFTLAHSSVRSSNTSININAAKY